jgi:hypothetical protein
MEPPRPRVTFSDESVEQRGAKIEEIPPAAYQDESTSGGAIAEYEEEQPRKPPDKATSKASLTPPRSSGRTQQKDYSKYRLQNPDIDRNSAKYFLSMREDDSDYSSPIVGANHLTMYKASRSDRAQDAEEAGIAEVTNMLKTHKALLGVHFQSIPVELRKKIMMLHMFFKDKTDPAVAYIKMKGRLVIDGRSQDENTYDKIASPTANPITIMLMIHLLAVYDRECATLDVPAAFLTPPMEDNVEFYAVMNAKTAELAIKVDPSLKQYLAKDGRLYFRLLKYLYGLHQASMIFKSI